MKNQPVNIKRVASEAGVSTQTVFRVINNRPDVAGAEAEARRQVYSFMLGSTQRNPEGEPAYIRLLTEPQVGGILWTRPSAEPDDRHLLALLDSGFPVVTTAYHPLPFVIASCATSWRA